jgi:hypothetical protein
MAANFQETVQAFLKTTRIATDPLSAVYVVPPTEAAADYLNRNPRIGVSFTMTPDFVMPGADPASREFAQIITDKNPSDPDDPIAPYAAYGLVRALFEKNPGLRRPVTTSPRGRSTLVTIHPQQG